MVSKSIMDELTRIVLHQLNNLFFTSREEETVLIRYIYSAKKKTVECISAFNNKYFNGEIYPYNSVIYCVFLFWLGRIIWLKEAERKLCDKIYYLNKALNAVDLLYEIELPNIWSCEHPVGAVMGRAKYGNRFYFCQGCTVGGNYNKDGELIYPIIGDDVMMYSNSKIVGASVIGNNVSMAANSYVINTNIPDNSIVFGQGLNIVIKEKH